MQPSRWLAAFFFCLILLPPLPFPFGNSGIHVAPFFALLGVIVSLAWIREWRSCHHALTLAFAIFFIAVLVESVAFAALYSGGEIAAGSLARVVLFAIGPLIFLYAYASPEGWKPVRLARALFGLAAAGALFACADFYFQFPAPGGYADQFVYLEEGVFRRAQGFFYEASTLGNFCAFFVVMIMIYLFRRRDVTILSRRSVVWRGSDFCGGVDLLLFASLRFSRWSWPPPCSRFLHFGRVRHSLIVLFAAPWTAAESCDSFCRAPPVGRTIGDDYGEFSRIMTRPPIRFFPDAWGTGRFCMIFWCARPGTRFFKVGYKTLSLFDLHREHGGGRQYVSRSAGGDGHRWPGGVYRAQHLYPAHRMDRAALLLEGSAILR